MKNFLSALFDSNKKKKHLIFIPVNEYDCNQIDFNIVKLVKHSIACILICSHLSEKTHLICKAIRESNREYYMALFC